MYVNVKALIAIIKVTRFNFDIGCNAKQRKQVISLVPKKRRVALTRIKPLYK